MRQRDMLILADYLKTGCILLKDMIVRPLRESDAPSIHAVALEA
jgi:hypothetical protein